MLTNLFKSQRLSTTQYLVLAEWSDERHMMADENVRDDIEYAADFYAELEKWGSVKSRAVVRLDFTTGTMTDVTAEVDAILAHRVGEAA